MKSRTRSIRALLAASFLATPALAGSNSGDFDGDGYDDLAVGVPNEKLDANNQTDAGAVNVIYGGASGLTSVGNQLWVQDDLSLGSETGDLFGWALACGDFNSDGYSDLAVGMPGESVAAVEQGAVVVIYGSAAGLTSAGRQFWTQDSSGIQGVGETGDGFGSALASGDFNSDGYDDLAVGVPYEDDGSSADSGAVHILYGGSAGLKSSGNQLWLQSHLGTTVEANDRFGFSLATGDLGKTSHADLAIGIPLEDIGSLVDAGQVAVLYGTPTGLLTTGRQIWNQNSTGIGGSAEAYDEFGFSLAIGNFGGNSQADLAVGVPHEAFAAGVTQAGCVNVIYGSSTGLTSAGNQLWSQNTTGIAGSAEFFDHFGWTLITGNFNGTVPDTYADLAIGAYGEDSNAGVVHVIYGTSGGLSATNSQLWTPANVGIGTALGYGLAAGNFGNSSYQDLAIGAPWHDLSPFTAAGSVAVLYGSASRLTTSGRQIWSQDSSGIEGSAYYFESFGQCAASSR